MRKGLLVGLSTFWAVACSSSTQPKLAPCTAASAGQLSLAVAGYTAIDPTQTAGCAVFGTNPSAAALQYLLVPQAGSALGLVQVARRAFPEWGVSLETLAVAMIGVHEVVGPICFRRALKRAGEITEDSADAEGSPGGAVVTLGRRL